MARTIGWSTTATRRNNSAVLRPMAADVSCFVNATVIRLDVNAIAQIIGVPSDKAGPDCAAYLEKRGCEILQSPTENCIYVRFCCDYQFKKFIHEYLLENANGA